MYHRFIKQTMAAFLVLGLLVSALAGCGSTPQGKVKCPGCSAVISGATDICPACGKRLVPQTCKSCEAVLAENAAFCSACGTAVNEEKQEEPAEQPTPDPEPEVQPQPAPEQAVTPEPSVQNVNLLANTTKEQRYRINVFLSNFAEQAWFEDYPIFDNLEYHLLQFLFAYSLINAPKTVDDDGEYFVISKDRADEVLKRFFGETIQPAEGQRFDSPDGGAYDYYEFRNGKYRCPAATGEFYGYLAVADSMVKNPDGTYSVAFCVYQVDGEYYMDNGIPKEFYYFTPEQAQSNGLFTCVADGEAWVKDYTHDSKETYQLLSYQAYR